MATDRPNDAEQIVELYQDLIAYLNTRGPIKLRVLVQALAWVLGHVAEHNREVLTADMLLDYVDAIVALAITDPARKPKTGRRGEN